MPEPERVAGAVGAGELAERGAGARVVDVVAAVEGLVDAGAGALVDGVVEAAVVGGVEVVAVVVGVARVEVVVAAVDGVVEIRVVDVVAGAVVVVAAAPVVEVVDRRGLPGRGPVEDVVALSTLGGTAVGPEAGAAPGAATGTGAATAIPSPSDSAPTIRSAPVPARTWLESRRGCIVRRPQVPQLLR